MTQEEIREIIKCFIRMKVKRQHIKICGKQGKKLQHLQHMQKLHHRPKYKILTIKLLEEIIRENLYDHGKDKISYIGHKSTDHIRKQNRLLQN